MTPYMDDRCATLWWSAKSSHIWMKLVRMDVLLPISVFNLLHLLVRLQGEPAPQRWPPVRHAAVQKQFEYVW